MGSEDGGGRGEFGASSHACHPRRLRRGCPKSVPLLCRLFFLRALSSLLRFLSDIMHTFGFRLLDFTPNAVAFMALFAHLCEGFAGVHPNTALFRHYFSPRIQPGGAISGCIAWVSRSMGAYPEGAMKERWEEWRGRWCWIKEKDPPNFCRGRNAPPVRRGDWSDVDAVNAKLTVATTRILCLTEAGLTLEMIGEDFIRRRIAPLHNKGRPA